MENKNQGNQLTQVHPEDGHDNYGFMSCLICHSFEQNSQTFSKHLVENGHNCLYYVNHVQ